MIVVITLLILGLIIFLHELGHFATAKYFGMPVSEFSIGMGPVIFKKTKGSTQYSLRLIPIGGFVSIDGMIEASRDDKDFEKFTDEEIEEYNKNGFMSHPKYQKIIVLSAGVIMNFATAFIAAILYSLFVGKGFELVGKIFIGGFYQTLLGIKMLLTGAAKANQLVGPVGLPSVVGQIVEQAGYMVLFNLFALLSINIGILNLLPIPALDGGRIIFVILEYFGIKVNKKIEEYLHMIGLGLLLLLMVYVFYNDISRIVHKYF